jgi:hypothetical protein
MPCDESRHDIMMLMERLAGGLIIIVLLILEFVIVRQIIIGISGIPKGNPIGDGAVFIVKIIAAIALPFGIYAYLKSLFHK